MISIRMVTFERNPSKWFGKSINNTVHIKTDDEIVYTLTGKSTLIEDRLRSIDEGRGMTLEEFEEGSFLR